MRINVICCILNHVYHFLPLNNAIDFNKPNNKALSVLCMPTLNLNVSKLCFYQQGYLITAPIR